MGRRFLVMVLLNFFLFSIRHDILVPHSGSPCPSRLPQVEPPVPTHNKSDVEQVKGNHADRFPEMQLAVNDEAHAEGSGDKKEANVTDKALAGDLKGANEGHGA